VAEIHFWGLIIIHTPCRIPYHTHDVPRRRVAEIPFLGVNNDTHPFVFPAVQMTSPGGAWQKSLFWGLVRHRALGAKRSAPRLMQPRQVEDCSFSRAQTPKFPGAPGRRRGVPREPLGRSSRRRGLQNGPRRPRDAQRSPKDAQDGLKTAQEASNTTQEAAQKRFYEVKYQILVFISKSLRMRQTRVRRTSSHTCG